MQCFRCQKRIEVTKLQITNVKDFELHRILTQQDDNRSIILKQESQKDTASHLITPIMSKKTYTKKAKKIERKGSMKNQSTN